MLEKLKMAGNAARDAVAKTAVLVGDLNGDGKVDEDSVEKNAYLLVEGLPERIPLKVLSDKVKAEMLRPLHVIVLPRSVPPLLIAVVLACWIYRKQKVSPLL